MPHKNAPMKASSMMNRDPRGDASGSSVGLRRRLPPLGTQYGDARGRAPKSSEDASTGMSNVWPTSSSKVSRTDH